MADERLRALERDFQADPTPEHFERLARAQARAGRLALNWRIRAFATLDEVTDFVLRLARALDPELPSPTRTVGRRRRKREQTIDAETRSEVVRYGTTERALEVERWTHFPNDVMSPPVDGISARGIDLAGSLELRAGIHGVYATASTIRLTVEHDDLEPVVEALLAATAELDLGPASAA